MKIDLVDSRRPGDMNDSIAALEALARAGSARPQEGARVRWPEFTI